MEYNNKRGINMGLLNILKNIFTEVNRKREEEKQYLHTLSEGKNMPNILISIMLPKNEVCYMGR